MRKSRSNASGLAVAKALHGNMTASDMNSCIPTIGLSRAKGAARILHGWMR